MSEETPNPEPETEIDGPATTNTANLGRADLADDDVDGVEDRDNASFEPSIVDGPIDPIAALEAEVADLRDKLLRAMAETENVRKRAEVARKDSYTRARADFAREILDAVDNMERALVSVDENARKESEAMEALYVGVDMTRRNMMAAFERAGIKTIETEGRIFNPALHEAMFELPSPDVAEGTIVQVVRPGYTLGDFLVRPAQVGVARGGARPDAASKSGASDEADTRVRTPGADAYGQKDGPAGGQLDEKL